MDASGAVLLETLVRPSSQIPEDASAVNGITDQEVANAPTWPEVGKIVADLVVDRLVIAHNAVFDTRMLRQTCMRYGANMPMFQPDCTMMLLTEINGGRWPNLGLAESLVSLEVSGQQHRARADAELCRQIVLALVAPDS